MGELVSARQDARSMNRIYSVRQLRPPVILHLCSVLPAWSDGHWPVLPLLLPLLGRDRPCDCGHAVHKLGPEDDVRIVEHALLQRDHNKLQEAHTVNKESDVAVTRDASFEQRSSRTAMRPDQTEHIKRYAIGAAPSAVPSTSAMRVC
jgi:hypothetical protein